MTFSARKIVTSIAWGLAFDSMMELLLAGAFGGFAGAKIGKGQNPDEISASLKKSFGSWDKIAPPVAGLIGLSLGLLGQLPGTKNR